MRILHGLICQNQLEREKERKGYAPSAISKISHHANPSFVLLCCTGPSVIVGPAPAAVPVVVAVTLPPLPPPLLTTTSSPRHTPSPAITPVPQLLATHCPARSTSPPAHERHSAAPLPEHVAQVLSHATHAPFVLSKNSAVPHVGTQRPFWRTGRAAGQEVHWEKDAPEQVRQSGWHVRHVFLAEDDEELVEEKVLEGQEERHCPPKAERVLSAQERQNVAESAQVLHVESHAVGWS